MRINTVFISALLVTMACSSSKQAKGGGSDTPGPAGTDDLSDTGSDSTVLTSDDTQTELADDSDLETETETETEQDSGSDTGTEVQVPTRPTAVSCETTRLPGFCVDDMASACDAGMDCCRTDSECTEGVNGRCFGGIFGLTATCYCTYDTCVQDADCGPDETCGCGGEVPIADTAVRTEHQCRPSTCHVNADCESDECSPTYFEECNQLYHVVGYHCRSSLDTCRVDTDCLGEATAPSRFCLYDADLLHWRCTESWGCP